VTVPNVKILEISDPFTLGTKQNNHGAANKPKEAGFGLWTQQTEMPGIATADISIWYGVKAFEDRRQTPLQEIS
jgi:hypothetical protein